MQNSARIIVALSGGVDSAVAAWLLLRQGHDVECLHMSNWDDDDGYCTAAGDLQDARKVAEQLGLTLHRVNFAREYRAAVFDDFLAECNAGRTPNPDVLCNREIKFGAMLRYAKRLGADKLATGHYARLADVAGERILQKAKDKTKDQSYFLHAVAAADFADVIFPLGELSKLEVRAMAQQAGLDVADKRDSTGICFIGERPFDRFLSQFLAPRPGPIVTAAGAVIGEHQGLHFYTLGQRKGLRIGGIEAADEKPWYVAAKRNEQNELVVVQGTDHPALTSDWLKTDSVHWIGAPPAAWQSGGRLRLKVKTRYRQADQAASVFHIGSGCANVVFDAPQRAVTPGQYAVFYLDDRCLGGASIRATGKDQINAAATAEAGRSTAII